MCCALINKYTELHLGYFLFLFLFLFIAQVYFAQEYNYHETEGRVVYETISKIV